MKELTRQEIIDAINADSDGLGRVWHWEYKAGYAGGKSKKVAVRLELTKGRLSNEMCHTMAESINRHLFAAAMEKNIGETEFAIPQFKYTGVWRVNNWRKVRIVFEPDEVDVFRCSVYDATCDYCDLLLEQDYDDTWIEAQLTRKYDHTIGTARDYIREARVRLGMT